MSLQSFLRDRALDESKGIKRQTECKYALVANLLEYDLFPLG